MSLINLYSRRGLQRAIERASAHGPGQGQGRDRHRCGVRHRARDRRGPCAGACASGSRRPRRRRCASKAAINALTQYTATEFGKQGVRANAIAPGLIVTAAAKESGHAGAMSEMMLANHLTPRVGEPRDVAYAVLFLASDEAAFITGQVINVDGGLLAHAPYYSELMAKMAAG